MSDDIITAVKCEVCGRLQPFIRPLEVVYGKDAVKDFFKILEINGFGVTCHNCTADKP